MLIAQGDSWFDLPGQDLVSALESHGFEVDSIAHHGTTLGGMAYDQGQSQRLARVFQRCARRGERPSGVLLSAGGNDIAGDELVALLNHAHSGLPPLSEDLLKAVIDVRLRHDLYHLISGVNALSRLYFEEKLPVYVHGYGYVVPDGRGFLGAGWIMPGPWLRPSLARKGYTDPMQCRLIMRTLIDRFNAMLSRLPEYVGMDNVRYVDLRTSLESGDHREMWSDELHPTGRGFALAAECYVASLQGAA